LKQIVCEEPVLIQPDQTKPFEVEVDTSNYAIGTILMQRDDKNILHPVHQQEHRFLPDFLLVPSRKAVQVAQVHKSNVGLLFNINFNNINLFD